MQLSIVFMGTPEFAKHSLKVLHEAGVIIKAVITAPDKPAGRGQKLKESDVKKYALSQNLKVLQPKNLKSEDFIHELTLLEADLFVVVAFRMLPEIVWSMPPKGTINLHASLLPQFRGAAPINWAIIHGQEETGVTTFFIEKEIDTGNIISQTKTSISRNETVGELYERLMRIGSDLLFETIINIDSGNIESVSQEKLMPEKLLKAPKIFKGDCEIDFIHPVINVHNHVRGLDPYPGAWVNLVEKSTGNRKRFKIYNSNISSIPVKNSESLMVHENGILFPCADYYLSVKEIQLEGKRRMPFKDFLAGNNMDDFKLDIKNV